MASKRLGLGLVPRCAQDRLVLCLVPLRSGAQGRLVLCLVPSKRAFTMDLSPFGRGGSPDGLAISFRLQLAELSQLAEGYLNQTQQSRLAQQVTLSIRYGVGTAANELGEDSRRERLGCPAHP
jgi:hypothetical protein